MMNSKPYKRSRLLYHAEAALEYLVALTVSGSFLAYLTASLGISDSLTGIISSIISLGCLFQLCSLFVRRKRFKTFVIWASMLNQLSFMMLYVLPMGRRLPSSVKTAAFVLMIVVAYFIYNLAHPKKIGWFMSLVPEAERGRFTAIKEIISLITGIVYTFVMGKVVDYFDAQGNPRGVFITGAVTIFVLMVMHTLTMIFSIEPVDKDHPTPRLRVGIRNVLGNPQMRRVVTVFILYNIAAYSLTPFLGSYQIKELGLSQATIALIAGVGSLVRVFVSVPMGNLADKVGFAKVFRLCLVIQAVGVAAVTVSGAETGLFCMLAYYVFGNIGMSGISSGTMNLVFDYVPKESRADALAITQAIGGTVGFVTTLCVSPLITLIQNNGNEFLGLPVYAQQVVAVLAVTFEITTMLYLHLALIRKKK